MRPKGTNFWLGSLRSLNILSKKGHRKGFAQSPKVSGYTQKENTRPGWNKTKPAKLEKVLLRNKTLTETFCLVISSGLWHCR